MSSWIEASGAWFATWWAAVLLGLATIGAYGTTYYAIGVLIPVIVEDTGWSTGVLALAFSLGVGGQAPAAMLAGRVFDRRGSGPILITALVVGCAFLLAASFATSPMVFVLTWAAGAAAISGGIQYNITMPAVSRIYPDRRTGAMAVLTFLGALSSPIFYPAAGWLVDASGWETALRALVALSALCIAPAALFVRAPAAAAPARGSLAAGLGMALRTPSVSRLLLHYGLASAATSALLLFQFSVLAAAGLTVALASTLAGVRGLMQIPGRLLITPIVRRLGLTRAIGGSHVTALAGTIALILALAGGPPLPLAIAFVVTAGLSLGLLSPLNGLMQAEVYGDARLGTLSGATVVVSSASAAAGAWVVGAVIDGSGSMIAGLALVATGQMLALGALAWQAAAPRDDPAAAEDRLETGQRTAS